MRPWAAGHSWRNVRQRTQSRVTAKEEVEGTAQQNDILRVVLSYVNDKSPP